MKQLPHGVQTDKTIVHEAKAWCIEQWGHRWEVTGYPKGTWCVFWGGFSMNSQKQTAITSGGLPQNSRPCCSP